MRLSNVINNLSLNIKLLILAAIALIAIAVPTGMYVQSASSAIASTSLELKGFDTEESFFATLKVLQQHRGLAAGVLSGSGQQVAELSAEAAEVDKGFLALNQAIKVLGSADLNEKIKSIMIDWGSLKSAVNSKSIDAPTSFARHNKLVADLLSFSWDIGAVSGLWYDPAVASYHLIIASLDTTPRLIESLAQVRGLSNGALVSGSINESQHKVIFSNIAYIKVYREALLMHLSAAASADATLGALAQQAKEQLLAVNDFSNLVDQEILSKRELTLDPKTLWSKSTRIIDELFIFNKGATDLLDKALKERIATAEKNRNLTLLFLGLLIGVCGYLGWVIAKSLKVSLTAAQAATTDIVNGNFDITLDTARQDEFGELNKAMLAMSAQLADVAKMQVENSRIRSALDATSTNVMLADNDRNIIYMNKSVEIMLRRVESDLRKALPHFNVDKVLGGNMDIFHKNPAHQSHLLATLKDTYVGNIVVAGLSFRLIASPIFDTQGNRLGSVVEWIDRTKEVAAEGEVSGLVQAAGAGNFKVRIPTEGKTGFFLNLAEGLNALMQTSDIGLGEVNRVLGAIAKGDLTEKITAEYSGTFGELKDYCNSTTESLGDIIGEIRTAAETIFTASSEIASGNADLSSRTEQQAANLEETASSMEELTSTVKLNADNAKQANVLAEQAATVATDGGELIGQVVTTMNAINESSQKIADIIGVIDGIAFQTNILALNAAVEAARAGDQGRGFAVVASEVRTLAQRSANAAKDIKALISDSVKKIESGNTLVGKSGDTMKEIVTAIKRVNDIMAEIAAASAEQSSGIEEVSTAVSQMDEMTQQNAALVEEAAAAAESLQSQADQLTQRVSQFRLANDSGRASHKPVARLSAPTKSEPTKSTSAISKKLSPPKNQDDEWESF
ncbi:MAG: methyl-accepting chemotaxis protein [Marinagarivorans sp.]|nr:methyl-accepting chemotaxis protein [Marinagarivorans sp.]